MLPPLLLGRVAPMLLMVLLPLLMVLLLPPLSPERRLYLVPTLGMPQLPLLLPAARHPQER